MTSLNALSCTTFLCKIVFSNSYFCKNIYLLYTELVLSIFNVSDTGFVIFMTHN